MIRLDEIDTTAVGWFKSSMYVIWVAVISALEYLAIDPKIIYVFSAALVFDWITGVIKAYRLKQFTSKRSIGGMIDKTILMFVPLLLAFFFKVFGIEIGVTVKLIFAVLTLSEFYSSLSNIHATRTGQELPEYDAITAIIKWIGRVILKFVKSKTDETDNT